MDILLVEASDLVRSDLKAGFQAMYHQVTAFPTSAEAKSVYQVGRYALVVVGGPAFKADKLSDSAACWAWADDLWQAGQAVIVVSASGSFGYQYLPVIEPWTLYLEEAIVDLFLKKVLVKKK